MTEESATRAIPLRDSGGREAVPKGEAVTGSGPGPVLLLARPGPRRSATARWMRARGLAVREVGTPLEAIALLQDDRAGFSSLFVVGSVAGVPSVFVAEALAEVFPAVRVVPG